MKKLAMLSAGCLSLVAATVTSPVTGAPLYPNSVVSNDHEFIATSDQSAFARTMIMYPGRLSAGVEQRAREIMPNRIAFFEELFLADQVLEESGREPAC